MAEPSGLIVALSSASSPVTPEKETDSTTGGCGSRLGSKGEEVSFRGLARGDEKGATVGAVNTIVNSNLRHVDIFETVFDCRDAFARFGELVYRSIASPIVDKDVPVFLSRAVDAPPALELNAPPGVHDPSIVLISGCPGASPSKTLTTSGSEILMVGLALA